VCFAVWVVGLVNFVGWYVKIIFVSEHNEYNVKSKTGMFHYLRQSKGKVVIVLNQGFLEFDNNCR
jgi:hypothetical protein